MQLLRPFAAAIAVLTAFAALADAYSEYIDRYAPIAVEQMKESGIPASITLAQGLLESAAGRSTLASQGNNHFGIKCHRDWTGDTMLRDDDAPDECFRVYRSAAESYRDHTAFLKGKRYRPLFELDPTDYASWARVLRECGYATDPNYADRLITIIERYALYSYDGKSSEEGHEIAEYIISTLAGTHPIRKTRGIHYVIAAPGDTYAGIAKEFHLKKKDLMAYNDARHDGHIKEWEEVFLQPKLDEAPPSVKTATIGEGESMHSLSQRFAIKLSRLHELNPDAVDAPGTTLRLRQ